MSCRERNHILPYICVWGTWWPLSCISYSSIQYIP